jgi:glycosyltransferase involved in cell wall biosynthesis
MEISVVMPVWNMASSLERSVNTILNQTYRDFELIVVDDGSSDETPQILARLACSDRRIRLLHQSNSGIVVALNLGVREASGKYIARADGDDLYEPERFDLQRRYLDSNPDVVLLCCDYYLSYPDGTGRLMTLPVGHMDILRRLLRRNEIMHSSVMLRRQSLIDAGGYSEGWRHLEDYELWFRLARHGQVASIQRPLAQYRIHAGGVSQKMEIYQIRRSLLLRLRILLTRQVPLSWIRYLPSHLVKAALPITLLRFLRRVTSQTMGVS